MVMVASGIKESGGHVAPARLLLGRKHSRIHLCPSSRAAWCELGNDSARSLLPSPNQEAAPAPLEGGAKSITDEKCCKDAGQWTVSTWGVQGRLWVEGQVRLKGKMRGKKALSKALRPGSTRYLRHLVWQDRLPGSRPHSLAGPLKRFTGWRSVGTNVHQRECGADITSPWPWGKEDISDRLLWRHVPRTHDVSSRQCQLTPAPPRVHYLLLLPPSLHGFCFYSLYTWQSNRSRKHSQLRMALLHLHQEIWQPPLHILTSSKPEDAGFLTYPQETTGGSGGQNIPSTGCLSLFWFDITSFCKVSNHSHWKCVHWGHSQTLTLKREKWAQSWVLRAESLVPIIYHKVPNA